MLPRGTTLSSLLVAALAALAAGTPAWAQQRGPRADESTKPQVAWELGPETRRVIRQGVEWLAEEQLKRSGRWPCRRPEWQLSVTSLAGLALVAHGVSPDRGPHSDTLRRCVEWLLDNQKQEGPFKGLICDRPNPMEAKERPMHGHGFALLLLGQVYGTSHDPALRERLHVAIVAGVRLTERTISPRGGWYYYPRSQGDEGSVTITQLQALRSARNAGIAVSSSVVERALEYVRKSQQPDGGVQYMLNRGNASAALTAAGVVCLQSAGEYGSDAIERGYAYLRRNIVIEFPERQKWFFYTHLYAAQAMFQRGGAAWKGYFPRIRQELLSLKQGRHWESPYGSVYGTAISLLILQLPNRFLPIYQR